MPGEIYTAAVRDQVGQRLEEIDFEDLGEKTLKNIASARPGLSRFARPGRGVGNASRSVEGQIAEAVHRGLAVRQSERRS